MRPARRQVQASHQVLAKAFAAPTAIASASSYRSFLKYGARLPAPAMWLLTGNTEEALFSPWLKALSRLSGKFRILDHREPLAARLSVAGEPALRPASQAHERRVRLPPIVRVRAELHGIERRAVIGKGSARVGGRVGVEARLLAFGAAHELSVDVCATIREHTRVRRE